MVPVVGQFPTMVCRERSLMSECAARVSLTTFPIETTLKCPVTHYSVMVNIVVEQELPV